MKSGTSWKFAAVLAMSFSAIGQSLAVAQSSWDYYHRHSERNPAWLSEIEARINRIRPRPDGVNCILSNGRDVHCWFRRDGDGPTYAIQNMQPAALGSNWTLEVAEMLSKGTIRFIGVNVSDPPQIWYFVVR